MISYFIIALHVYFKLFEQTLSLNFRSFLVRNPFLLKLVHFTLVSLSQDSTKCLLANGWWNTCFYHYSFLHQSFPSLLTSPWFVVKYFSFAKKTVLMVFHDYSFVATKSPIFFFICLQMIAFEYFPYDLIFDISV